MAVPLLAFPKKNGLRHKSMRFCEVLFVFDADFELAPCRGSGASKRG